MNLNSSVTNRDDEQQHGTKIGLQLSSSSVLSTPIKPMKMNKMRANNKQIELQPLPIMHPPPLATTIKDQTQDFSLASSSLLSILCSPPKPFKNFPRLQTIPKLAYLHTESMHTGTFAKRSAMRWRTLDQRQGNASDAEQAFAVVRESSALIIQCAWRQCKSYRVKESLKEEILQRQLQVAALISAYYPGIQHFNSTFALCHSLRRLDALFLDTRVQDPNAKILSTWGLYYHGNATLLQFHLHFAFTKHKTRFMCRSPMIMNAIDLPVKTTCFVLARYIYKIVHWSVLILQCWCRRHRALIQFRQRQRELRRQRAATQIQCMIRMFLAKSLVHLLRSTRNCLIIQCAWRCYMARQKVYARHFQYRAERVIIEALDIGLKHAFETIINEAASKIQRLYRGRLARLYFRLLTSQRRQARWKMNPSKGFAFFHLKNYLQAALFLEKCFLEGIFADPSRSSNSQQQRAQLMASSSSKFASSKKITTIQKEKEEENASSIVEVIEEEDVTHVEWFMNPLEEETEEEKLKFWQMYALSHFFLYENAGTMYNLQRAKVGFQAYLEIEVPFTLALRPQLVQVFDYTNNKQRKKSTRVPASEDQMLFLSIHSRYRLIQSLFWLGEYKEAYGLTEHVLNLIQNLINQSQLGIVSLSKSLMEKISIHWKVDVLLIQIQLSIALGAGGRGSSTKTQQASRIASTTSLAFSQLKAFDTRTLDYWINMVEFDILPLVDTSKQPEMWFLLAFLTRPLLYQKKTTRSKPKQETTKANEEGQENDDEEKDKDNAKARGEEKEEEEEYAQQMFTKVVTYLQKCFQYVELWPEVGYFHGILSEQKVYDLLVPAPAGSFLVHTKPQEEEFFKEAAGIPSSANGFMRRRSSASTTTTSSYQYMMSGETCVFLRVKLSDTPLRITSLKIMKTEEGTYYSRKVPECTHFSLIGFLKRLPAIAGLNLLLGIRKPLFQEEILNKMTAKQKESVQRQNQQRRFLLHFEQWIPLTNEEEERGHLMIDVLKKSELVQKMASKRNKHLQMWHLLCFFMAQRFESWDIFGLAKLLSMEIVHRVENPRSLRAQTSVLLARICFYLHQRPQTRFFLQQAQLLSTSTTKSRPSTATADSGTSSLEVEDVTPLFLRTYQLALSSKHYGKPSQVNTISAQGSSSTSGQEGGQIDEEEELWRQCQQAKQLQQQTESFQAQLERIQKLDRLVVKAWKFDTFSYSLQGNVFKEALLLERIDDELFMTTSRLNGSNYNQLAVTPRNQRYRGSSITARKQSSRGYNAPGMVFSALPTNKASHPGTRRHSSVRNNASSLLGFDIVKGQFNAGVSSSMVVPWLGIFSNRAEQASAAVEDVLFLQSLWKANGKCFCSLGNYEEIHLQKALQAIQRMCLHVQYKLLYKQQKNQMTSSVLKQIALRDLYLHLVVEEIPIDTRKNIQKHLTLQDEEQIDDEGEENQEESNDSQGSEEEDHEDRDTHGFLQFKGLDLNLCLQVWDHLLLEHCVEITEMVYRSGFSLVETIVIIEALLNRFRKFKPQSATRRIYFAYEEMFLLRLAFLYVALDQRKTKATKASSLMLFQLSNNTFDHFYGQPESQEEEEEEEQADEELYKWKQERKYLLKAIVIMNELLSLRQQKHAQEQLNRATFAATKKIVWPCVMALSRFKDEEMLFLRGWMRRMLVPSNSSAYNSHSTLSPTKRNNCKFQQKKKKKKKKKTLFEYTHEQKELSEWDFQHYHQLLVSKALQQQSEETKLKKSLPFKIKQFKGLRVFVGGTKDLPIKELFPHGLLKAKPTISIKSEGKISSTKNKPTWQDLSPKWEEYIEMDVTSYKARFQVLLFDGPIFLASVEISIQELLEQGDNEFEPRWYKWKRPDQHTQPLSSSGSKRRTIALFNSIKPPVSSGQIYLGFQVMLHSISTTKRQVNETHNNMMISLSTNQFKRSPHQIDLTTIAMNLLDFVHSSQVWIFFADKMMSNQDHVIAKILYEHAISLQQNGPQNDHVGLTASAKRQLALQHQETANVARNRQLLSSIEQMISLAICYRALAFKSGQLDSKKMFLSQKMFVKALRSCEQLQRTRQMPSNSFGKSRNGEIVNNNFTQVDVMKQYIYERQVMFFPVDEVCEMITQTQMNDPLRLAALELSNGDKRFQAFEQELNKNVPASSNWIKAVYTYQRATPLELTNSSSRPCSSSGTFSSSSSRPPSSSSSRPTSGNSTQRSGANSSRISTGRGRQNGASSARPMTSRIYYLNQDTGECVWEEPLEYENETENGKKQVLNFFTSDRPHRILILRPQMQQKLKKLYKEMMDKFEKDPFKWKELYDANHDCMQFFSQMDPSVYLFESSKPPESYVMVVNEFTLSQVLILQNAIRKMLRRKKCKRIFRAIVHMICWSRYEICQAQKRIVIQQELQRKLKLNTIHLIIEKATHLRAADLISSDPFVYVQVLDGRQKIVQKARTSVRRNTLNPNWHEEFNLTYTYRHHEELFRMPLRERELASKMDQQPRRRKRPAASGSSSSSPKRMSSFSVTKPRAKPNRRAARRPGILHVDNSNSLTSSASVPTMNQHLRSSSAMVEDLATVSTEQTKEIEIEGGQSDPASPSPSPHSPVLPRAVSMDAQRMRSGSSATGTGNRKRSSIVGPGEGPGSAAGTRGDNSPKASTKLVNPIVRLTVYDHDLGKNEETGDFLGMANIPLDPLDHGKQIEAELKLRDEDGYDSPRPRGTLYISIQWMYVEYDSNHEDEKVEVPKIIVRPRTPLPKICVPKEMEEMILTLFQYSKNFQDLMNQFIGVGVLLDQLTKLEKRYQEAQAIASAAEEAKVTEQRMSAVLSSQLIPKVSKLNELIDQVRPQVVQFESQLHRKIQEHVESLENEYKTKLMTQCFDILTGLLPSLPKDFVPLPNKTLFLSSSSSFISRSLSSTSVSVLVDIVEILHKWTLCAMELKDRFLGWKTSIEMIIQEFCILSPSSLLGLLLKVSSGSTSIEAEAIQLTKTQLKEHEEAIRLMKQLEVYQRIQQNYPNYNANAFKVSIVNTSSVNSKANENENGQEPNKKIDTPVVATGETPPANTATAASAVTQPPKKKFLGLSINTNVGRFVGGGGGGGQTDTATSKSLTPLSTTTVTATTAATPGSPTAKQSSTHVQKRLERIQREKAKRKFLK